MSKKLMALTLTSLEIAAFGEFPVTYAAIIRNMANLQRDTRPVVKGRASGHGR